MFKRLVSGLAAMAMILSGLMLQPTAAHAVACMPPAFLDAPKNLQGWLPINYQQNNDTYNVDLSWALNAIPGSETDFKLYDALNDGNDNYILLATLPSSTLATTISQLAPNTSYIFKLTTTDGNCESDPVTLVVDTAAGKPGVIVNSVGVNTADVSIDQKTNDINNSNFRISVVDNNNVQYNAHLGGSLTLAANDVESPWHPLSDWGNNVVLKGLTPNTQYAVYVYVYNTLRNEVLATPSDSALITTAHGPATPTNLSARIGTTSAAITWRAGANGNETKFILGDSTDGGNVFMVTQQPVLPQDQLTQCINEGGQVIPDCFYYTFEFKDLLPNTPHVFSVGAADDDGNFSATVTTSEKYTLVYRPDPPILNGATLNSLNITINPTDGNPDNTEYQILETTTNSFVLTNGSLISANLPKVVGEFWQTAAQWAGKTITGLTEGTAYEFQVKARNRDKIETNFSDPAKQFTLFPAKPAQVGGGGGGGGFLIPTNNTPNQTKVALVPDPITNVPVVVTEPKANGQVLGEKIALLDELIAKTKYGQTSNTVKQLQTELRNAGFFPRWVRSTGWYGPVTRAAVAKYQASK